MKIAIASSNGKDVDTHLGKSSSVYIYEYNEKNNESTFLEHKIIEINSDSKHQGQKIIKTLEDCDVIISTQHGIKTDIKAKELDLKLVDDEGTIEEVLKRYTDHVNFMKNVKI
ncbi:MAG: NifB/NifX family molybdenum-iron cluster-binding protein [Methanobacteriaceae archaeon]|nr:NifB/NifX family molybdenum-iron cluster-binding protein [Methanobacteriaceae archaeon]